MLLIGNVEYQKNDSDEAEIKSDSASYLERASQYLQIEEEVLKRAVSKKIVRYPGEILESPLKLHEANSARDAISRLLFSKIFDYVVGKINRSISLQMKLAKEEFLETTCIGLLDIYLSLIHI